MWGVTICKLGHHQWFVICLSPKHCLSQCWLIVNQTLRKHISEIWFKIHKFLCKKMNMKMWSPKWLPFCFSCNSLWPGSTIWWHGTRSTLAQVMAWCLTAPSHYLNQCWLITGEVPWHSSQGIIHRWCSNIMWYFMQPCMTIVEYTPGPVFYLNKVLVN